MYKNKKYNLLAILVAFCVVLGSFAVLDTQDTYAAAGGKTTIFVPTRIVTNGGERCAYSCNISYNKKGLPSVITYGSGMTVRYKYDKKGRLKSFIYKNRGQSFDKTKVKVNKKGLIMKTTVSDAWGKRTTTYKRRKNGTIKKTIVKAPGKSRCVSYFDKYGNRVSDVWTTGKTVDFKATFQLTLDSTGKILKQTETEVSKDYYTNRYSAITTYTYNNYDSYGNKIKETIYGNYMAKICVTTIQYQPIKVPKNRVKYVKEFTKNIATVISPD